MNKNSFEIAGSCLRAKDTVRKSSRFEGQKKKKYDISGILHEGPNWIPGKGSPGRWG